MQAGSAQKRVDGVFQIISRQCRAFRKIRLLAEAVFPPPNKNTEESGGHPPANVGFRVVAG
jgi:hypothetical protein